MTKGGNGNTDLAATAVPDLDRIEHRLAALLRLLETAPVPAEALADAIRVLAGLQAELAATIAAPSWSRGLPAAARPGRTPAQRPGESAEAEAIRTTPKPDPGGHGAR